MVRSFYSSASIFVAITLFIVGCSSDDVSPTASSEVVADFTMSGDRTIPATITFTNRSQNANLYRWDFGNGNFSTAINPPSQTYNSARTRNITLIASDTVSGRADTTIRTLTTNWPDPVADFSWSGVTTTPANITFTNSSQSADHYEWDFGDGATSSLQNPSHTYVSRGDYTVSLIASRSATSQTNTKRVILTISWPPDPIADFTWSGANVTPANIRFTNTSRNADHYEWDFDDGGTSTTASPSHIFSTLGVYRVSLIALKNGTPQTDTMSVLLTIKPGQVYIESITIEQIPFVDGSGSGWDLSTGPDLTWSIDNASGSQITHSPIYYSDIAPNDLPVTFDLSPNYRLPNARAEYTTWLWDYDDTNADDLIVGGTFDLTEYMDAELYETEVFWNYPNIQFRMTVNIRWQ